MGIGIICAMGTLIVALKLYGDASNRVPFAAEQDLSLSTENHFSEMSTIIIELILIIIIMFHESAQEKQIGLRLRRQLF